MEKTQIDPHRPEDSTWYPSQALLERVYRLSRFKVGDTVVKTVGSSDPSIDDAGHVGEVVQIYFGNTNNLQIKWRLPNIARYISRAYGDGKYLTGSLENPFHVELVK